MSKCSVIHFCVNKAHVLWVVLPLQGLSLEDAKCLAGEANWLELVINYCNNIQYVRALGLNKMEDLVLHYTEKWQILDPSPNLNRNFISENSFKTVLLKTHLDKMKISIRVSHELECAFSSILTLFDSAVIIKVIISWLTFVHIAAFSSCTTLHWGRKWITNTEAW